MSELKLPELPEPDAWRNRISDDRWLYSEMDPRDVHDNGKPCESLYTAAQMLAIRDSGIRYGMERAAVIADEAEEYDRTLGNNPQAAQAAEFIAKAIRAALQE